MSASTLHAPRALWSADRVDPRFVSDWRLESPARASAWLADECLYWQRRFGWDLSASWAEVEPARRRGELPGFVAEDADGQVRGWAFHVRHRDLLQIGSLLSADHAATDGLVDAVFSSPEATGAKGVVVFTRSAAPDLDDLLALRGCDVEAYRHLETPLEAIAPPQTTSVMTWPSDDEPVLALFERAYRASTSLRPFAPRGTAEEWREYLATLIATPSCGQFLADASGVVSNRHGVPAAATIVTAVGPDTAHLAQIAVDPAVRLRGLGEKLVRTAAARVRALGYTRLTLLVAERNLPALALYDKLGFTQTGEFLAAIKI